jgi:hypothetical protein
MFAARFRTGTASINNDNYSHTTGCPKATEKFLPPAIEILNKRIVERFYKMCTCGSGAKAISAKALNVCRHRWHGGKEKNFYEPFVILVGQQQR